MIVYTVKAGKYFSVPESLQKNSTDKRGIYINLTNRCNNDCVFCLREKKSMSPEKSLWLDKEPSPGEIENELKKIPPEIISEIVFCGFGEPTMRLKELTEILRYVRKNFPGVPTRLNTNGLGELEHGRDISPEFENILDVASISLNSATAEKYLQITHSKFGLPAYEGMLTFAEHMKKFVPEVVLTVVDKVTPPAEIEACRKICEGRNLKLRVRPYEAN